MAEPRDRVEEREKLRRVLKSALALSPDTAEATAYVIIDRLADRIMHWHLDVTEANLDELERVRTERDDLTNKLHGVELERDSAEQHAQNIRAAAREREKGLREALRNTDTQLWGWTKGDGVDSDWHPLSVREQHRVNAELLNDQAALGREGGDG